MVSFESCVKDWVLPLERGGEVVAFSSFACDLPFRRSCPAVATGRFSAPAGGGGGAAAFGAVYARMRSSNFCSSAGFVSSDSCILAFVKAARRQYDFALIHAVRTASF